MHRTFVLRAGHGLPMVIIVSKQLCETSSARKKLVLVYRYSVHDHAELYPVIPGVLQKLGEKTDVLYVGARCGAHASKYEYPGVTHAFYGWAVDRRSSRDKFFKSLLYYLALPFWALRLRARKPDLIWLDESIPFAGRIVQIFSGCPVAVCVNDFFGEVYSEKHRWLRPLAALALAVDKAAWRKARGLFTRTESMRRHLIGLGVDAGRVRVVRDAVIPDLFSPQDASLLRESLGFSKEDVVVCQHGVLHPNKGIPRCLKWMVSPMKENPHLKLLVIGDGPDRGELETIARDNGVASQVVFAGWLADHAAVSAHLNASDIGLVMRVGQYSDHFHVTGALIHSMMCGLPVLAARLAGIEEIVSDGQEGWLFDPQFGGEFPDKLRQLTSDAAMRGRMGKQGRTTALAEFAVHRVIDANVQTLNSFLGIGVVENDAASIGSK